MTLDNYKVVLYRNQPDGWVAEVPSIRGCYALMATREAALAELDGVFQMIAADYQDRGIDFARGHHRNLGRPDFWQEHRRGAQGVLACSQRHSRQEKLDPRRLA
jgi:predicted RNase H-like HicB family nuclease